MVFYNNKFHGYYPVGASAIVVADSREEASVMLNEKLKSMELKEITQPDDFEKVKTRTKGVIILNDGNY